MERERWLALGQRRFAEGSAVGIQNAMASTLRVARVTADMPDEIHGPRRPGERMGAREILDRHMAYLVRSDGRMAPGLQKPCQRASGGLRKTGKGRVRHDTATRQATENADACKTYANLRARMMPGGTIFAQCKNRAERKRMRACVHHADGFAVAGEYRYALECLRDLRA